MDMHDFPTTRSFGQHISFLVIGHVLLAFSAVTPARKVADYRRVAVELHPGMHFLKITTPKRAGSETKFNYLQVYSNTLDSVGIGRSDNSYFGIDVAEVFLHVVASESSVEIFHDF